MEDKNYIGFCSELQCILVEWAISGLLIFVLPIQCPELLKFNKNQKNVKNVGENLSIKLIV